MCGLQPDTEALICKTYIWRVICIQMCVKQQASVEKTLIQKAWLRGWPYYVVGISDMLLRNEAQAIILVKQMAHSVAAVICRHLRRHILVTLYSPKAEMGISGYIPRKRGSEAGREWAEALWALAGSDRKISEQGGSPRQRRRKAFLAGGENILLQLCVGN